MIRDGGTLENTGEIVKMTLRATLFLCLSLAVLAGCTGKPESFVAPNAEVGSAKVQRIYLATDRILAPDLSGTTKRGGALSFAQYDITIPPGHEPGEVAFSATNPDPTQSFTVAGARAIARLPELGQIVRAEAGSLGRPIDGPVVYVHGFNTAMEYAVYRHAQIAHDYGLQGPQVTFAWPSIERTLGYVRDKDSILIARDHLEELLVELTGDNQNVFVFGHSMGTQLVVETLRQLSITGQKDVLSRIGGVILVSPDIDLDLFEAQHERIDPMPSPFVVMTSESDYALRFSSLLTAQPERLGSARDRDRLAALDLLVLDLSGLPNARNHFLAATSPVVIDIVTSAREDVLADRFPSRGVIDVAAVQAGARH
ncbi:Esterase/lipase superfamily enzyme [Roseivivax halotolerans]|uniref:Esterase/lipase superfamily enzyme n=1 Tax=Roseivivax halotolerans TaxID=93684 RepID=A0A1I6A9P1_9RHOB|nr:alpha/beta fold hydrolase [Roseivivax halotolerans]SFQ65408.1 Esterase/lipase superfamily enzyme [Roseivivax halotolerans]